ncbi:glycosyltransferase [Flavobacterium sp.]|uniref:glycosyltransferase n=1 Tax=Flavobacterium sp. TaxID=239 RepID=UPI0033420C18
MKVLFTTDQIYKHGGIEKVMALKANYFARTLGYSVTILTTEQMGKAPCYPLDPSISLIDLEINYVRHKSYFHPVNFFRVFTHYRRWHKAMQTCTPDVVVVCNYAFDFFWIPFRVGSQVKTFKEYHSSRFYYHQSRQKASIFRRLWDRFYGYFESKYTKVVVLNPDEVAFYPQAQTVVIPNPMARFPQQASLKATKVIAAGRLAPVKGFERMIALWRDVVVQHPEWQLDIYGEGEPEYIAQLQQLIQHYQLDQHVFFKTPVPSLQPVLLDYSFYLMTSWTECFPMVLLEALSVGLPILAYDSPTGPRHIVTHEEDGFLAPEGDSAIMLKNITFVILNAQERQAMGARAYNHSSRFELPIVMASWQALIEKKG